MWASIYLYLPIHPSILMLSYLLQYMVRIIFKKIQLFLFWNGSVLLPRHRTNSVTPMHFQINVHYLHDTFTISLVGTPVWLADPESYCRLPPLVLCHHETDVPGHLSVGSQFRTAEEAQWTPDHRSPDAFRALSPSVPRGGRSQLPGHQRAAEVPFGGRTMQSDETLRTWYWKHLQLFQHWWRHGSSAAWRAGDAELAQPQHRQWKMPALGCHSEPLTLWAKVSCPGVCDFHKLLDNPSAQRHFWALWSRALKELGHRPRPRDRIKWQVCCVVALEEGIHAGQWGTRWPEQGDAHNPHSLVTVDAAPSGTQALCTDRLPAEQKHPQRNGVSPADTDSSPGGAVQPSSLPTCSSSHSICSRRHRPSTPPPLRLFQQRHQAPPAACDHVCSSQALETWLSFRAGASEGIHLGSRLRYYEQFRDHILKSRRKSWKKERQQLWPLLGRLSH